MREDDREAVPGGVPDLDGCAHANLRRALRVVSQVYDRALRPSGLRATQFTLLAVVARDDGLSLTGLAQRLRMDRTTLTRNLKPLLTSAWLQTATDRDQRVRRVFITGAGRDRVALATPLWRDAQADIARGSGSVRLSRLLKELNSMVDGLR